MTCVFKRETAACQLRGTVDDPRVTPDTDDCRPRCPNLARTDCDIEAVEAVIADKEEIVADRLAPSIRDRRDQHELDRLRAIVNAHPHSKDSDTP